VVIDFADDIPDYSAPLKLVEEYLASPVGIQIY
jgi:hypothetical protein